MSGSSFFRSHGMRPYHRATVRRGIAVIMAVTIAFTVAVGILVTVAVSISRRQYRNASDTNGGRRRAMVGALKLANLVNWFCGNLEA